MATETTAEATARPAGRGRARALFVGAFLTAALLGAAFVGYSYWRDATLYITTDDALVDATMLSISSPAGGTLISWVAQPGQRVEGGQTVGLVRPTTAGGVSAYSVAAPISGVLVRVDGREGQPVAASVPLAYVADLDHLRVTAYVDETEIAAVHVGQQVDITVDATGRAAYTGVVSEVVPATASQFALLPTTDRGSGNFTKVTQRIEVHIALDGTGGAALYPGENATVRIHR